MLSYTYDPFEWVTLPVWMASLNN